MSRVTYRCHSCGSTHELEHIRRNLYLAQRTIGDLHAASRGRLGRRLVRRAIARRLMKGLWGS